MEIKATAHSRIIRSDIIAEEQQITNLGLVTNESMSDISSVSELDSELGYASCENEDDSRDSCVSDGGQQRLRSTRRKLQRKHRLDQLRRYEIYSNDSDTTIDDTVFNARRIRRTAPKRGDIQLPMQSISVKSKEKVSNEFRRPRNGNKGSWTDSGVSMSKTDSQPSTLGERTKTKMTSQRCASINEWTEKTSAKSERFRRNLEVSPVELLRGEIRRRSNSALEFTRQRSGRGRERLQVAGRHQISNDVENADWKIMADCVGDSRLDENYVKRIGKTRYPEIIKLDDKEKPVKVKKVSSKKQVGKGVKSDGPEVEEASIETKVDVDFSDLNEKENEIIRKLLENAKEAESKRKQSVQSHWSNSTSDGTADSSEHIKPRRSKLQRLKEIFFRAQKSRNGGLATLSPLKKDNDRMGQCSSPSFDSYFSDDTSMRSACTDHLCTCDYDHLSHLGRVVQTKKGNILSRFFRRISKSSDNVHYQNGRMHRSRSQITSEAPIGRKRSGSTRSLPDSLRYLYMKALSKSVDNIHQGQMPPLLQQAGAFSPYPGFYVKRSRSSSSLLKCQLASNIPSDLSKSSDAISYHSHVVKSPPPVVRRSESLRSLNIGRNYDIATHVLQGRTTVDDVKENNNLLYHPFFEGHTTRDDCNMDTNQDYSSCACHLTGHQTVGGTTDDLKSPIASPSSYYKGQLGIFGKGNWDLVCGVSNDKSKLLSPQRRPSRDTMCSCHEDAFDTTCFFPGDVHKHCGNDSRQVVYQKEAADESPRRRANADCLVLAPLEIQVTKEKHAGRVRLKTAKDFDSSV